MAAHPGVVTAFSRRLLRDVFTDTPGGPKLHATFSFWATVAGLALSRTRCKRLSGVMLLAVGYGGLGVAWERLTTCDLRKLRRPERIVTSGIVTHAPMIFLGHRVLKDR